MDVDTPEVMITSLVRRGGIPETRSGRLSRAMIAVTGTGSLIAGAGLFFSARSETWLSPRFLAVFTLAVGGWCLWQMWTGRLYPVVVMAVFAALIGAAGLSTDPTRHLAVSTTLVLYAGVGAVLISETRHFWAFTGFVGVAGGAHFLAQQSGLSPTGQNDADFVNVLVQGVVFWTAAGMFRLVRDEIVTQDEIHRSKDKFLARMGHELRSPLTAVLGYSEMILADETTSAMRHDWVGEIVDAARRMSATIEDFTVVSRVDNQLLTLSPTTFSLKSVVEETLSSLPESHITPHVTGPSDIVVHTDRDRLRQIIRVLTTNATQHANAIVEISVSTKENTAWIEVVDDGPGLGEGVKTLFAATRHSHSEPGQPGHMGRGLHVALRLTDVMRLDLSYSRRANTTVFRLGIPVEPTPPTRIHRPTKTSSVRNPTTA